VSDLPVAEIQATAEERPELRAVQELVGRAKSGVRLRVGTDEVELPRSLVKGLVAVAGSLEDGDTVAIVSEQAELSPAQAARLLGVSRQYVDRLVASGVLSSRRLPKSSYRKVLVRDVLQHKTLRERKRAGVNRVVDEATAAGLEY
jgi:excisionase family DNA binding protein